MGGFTRFARRAARRVGIDVHRYSRATAMSAFDRAADLIAQREIDLLVDVGANTGQYATAMRDGGYRGRIVSYEPLSEAFTALQRASASDPAWRVVHAAVGAEPATISINIAGNSVSSSILPMGERHALAAPSSRYVGREQAEQCTLDAELGADPARAPFLKIDVQGYEDAVLDGAARVISRLVGVQLEMSFVELYEGQSLFDSLLHRLESEGFDLWTLIPGFTDPATGRLLQADGVFFRP